MSVTFACSGKGTSSFLHPKATGGQTAAAADLGRRPGAWGEGEGGGGGHSRVKVRGLEVFLPVANPP